MPTKKREESSRETKDKIFQSSARLFALNGYDGASMREIAKQADVNLALINYHFKDKGQLYKEVIEYGLSLWAQLLEAYRGQSLEKILTTLMKHTTDSKGTAYYMSIIMRLFIDANTSEEHRAAILRNGPPQLDVIQEAVAKELGEGASMKSAKLITHYLVYNLIMTSRIKFGASEEDQKTAAVTRLFESSNDPYTAQLLFLANSLCDQYRVV